MSGFRHFLDWFRLLGNAYAVGGHPFVARVVDMGSSVPVDPDVEHAEIMELARYRIACV